MTLSCADVGPSRGFLFPIAKDAVLACIKSYREHMAEFSEMKVLERWYFAVEAEMLIASIKDAGIRCGAIKNLAKARENSTSEGLFPKLVDDSDGSPIIKEQLPTIFHWKVTPPGRSIRTSSWSSTGTANPCCLTIAYCSIAMR